MIIDCQNCPVRDLHCDDCMVTTLVMTPGAQLPLDAAERAAVDRFFSAGLIGVSEAAGATARQEPWTAHSRAVG